MKTPTPPQSPSASIDDKIKELADWRGKSLAKVREIIHHADPEIVEEWKWRGTPVWSHAGIVCTGETSKKVVKLTFVYSTPASTATSGAPLTSTKPTRSMKRH